MRTGQSMARRSFHFTGPKRTSKDDGSFSSVIVDIAAVSLGPDDHLGPAGSPGMADVLARARLALAERRLLCVERVGPMGVTCINNPCGPGALVSALAPGSAAAAAGLLVGDTIVGVGGERVDSHLASRRERDRERGAPAPFESDGSLSDGNHWRRPPSGVSSHRDPPLR